MLKKIKEEMKILLKKLPQNFISQVKFLAIVKRNLKLKNIRLSKREIYYKAPNIFKSQKTTDLLIKYFLKKFQCQLCDLNITTGQKSLFYGEINFYADNKIECIKNSFIPDMEIFSDFSFNFSKILIVEKETVFSNIVDISRAEKKKLDFLLLCGKGYPSFNFIKFLMRIKNEVQIFGLFDFDPHGFDIWRIYNKHIKIMHIGLKGCDIIMHNFYMKNGIKFNETDKTKLCSLLCMHNLYEIKEDLIFLKGLQKKFEIEILMENNYLMKYIEEKLNKK